MQVQLSGKYQSTDQRHNICEIDQHISLDKNFVAKVKDQVSGVGSLVNYMCLEQKEENSDKIYKLSSYVKPFAQVIQKNWKDIPLGEHEAYPDEFQLAFGTAFMINKKLALTAAHCICKDKTNELDLYKINAIRLVFNFQMIQPNQCKVEFAKKDIYKIKKVICHNYINEDIDKREHWQDWALIKLDREVEGQIPLNVNFGHKKDQYLRGKQVYMLGFPNGQPMKFTGNGEISGGSIGTTYSCPFGQYFQANLDAFHGNSGSPIFESETNEPIGILCSGNGLEDYSVDKDYKGTGKKRIKLKPVTKRDINTRGSEKCQRLESLAFIQAYMDRFSLPTKTSDEMIHDMGKWCISLKKLKLEENSWGPRINNEGIPSLIHCLALEYLDLSYCDIKSKGLAKLLTQIHCLPSLISIDLTGNNLTDQDFDILTSLMPNSETQFLPYFTDLVGSRVFTKKIIHSERDASKSSSFTSEDEEYIVYIPDF